MDMQQLAVQAVVAGIFFWWFETTTFLLLFFFLSHFYNVYSCQQLSGEITSLNEKIARLERENAKARSHSARRRRGDKGKEKEEPHEEKSPKGSKIQKKESRSISPLREREENVFGSSPAPELPIKVMDLASSVEKEVYPNWRAPTPISNDWFEGECLLKVRTNPPDEVFEPYFEGKRRTIELQLKGRFKQLPRGPIYMGLEVPGPEMAWSFLTKSFANVILQVLKRLVPDSHHSFGAKNETPHIVLPLVSAIDYFIATPEGEKSPDLGVASLPVTNDRADYADGKEKFKIGPTYTLSFHSMYINVVTWKVTNIPGLRDIPFETFWGNRPLRLVAYDVGSPDPKSPHLSDDKRYYFNFEINKTGGEVFFPETETRTLKGIEKATSSPSPSSSPPSSPPATRSSPTSTRSPPSSTRSPPSSARSPPSSARSPPTFARSPPTSPRSSLPSPVSSPMSSPPSSPPFSPSATFSSSSSTPSFSGLSPEERETRRKTMMASSRENMKKTYFTKIGKKRVLNGRAIFYRSLGGGGVKQPKVLPPLLLSERLLSTALEWTSYSSSYSMSSSTSRRASSSFTFPPQPTQDFVEFIDTTSLLKTVLLGALTNTEKTAFFLNIFHTLLLHGLLIFGPPTASLKKWLQFFDRTSYEIAGHVVSLAEIEHNILRSRGSKPKLLGWAVGKWSGSDPRKQLSLTAFDPRINILLNYGSSVCPRNIPKFCPGRDLERQLNEAAAHNLDHYVKIEEQAGKKLQVSLPKSMYWYQYDFGPSESAILSWIFVRAFSDLKDQLFLIDKKGTFENAKIKFRSYPYDFNKRFAKLNLGMEDDDVSSLDQSMELDESQADFSDEDGITFTNSSG